MAFSILSRALWGAKPPKGKTPMPGDKVYVFIHHTVTADGPEDAEDNILRSIQNTHMNGNYSDIAYHFIIYPTGHIYEGRGWGIQGGATNNYNDRSYAICHAGNYEKSTPTQAQIDATRWLIAQGQAGGYIAKTPTIRGHREVSATACPGKYLYAKLPTIRIPWKPATPIYPSYRVSHEDGSSGVFKPLAPGESAFPRAWRRAEEIARDEGWVKVERL